MVLKFYILLICIVVFIFILILNNSDKKSSKIIIKDIHVINLDRATERWNDMQKELNKFGNIPITRWKAIDGKELNKEYVNSICKYTTYKSSSISGETGCYLSHKSLLEYLLKKDVDPNMGHLILEDDIIVNDKILEKFEKIAYNVPSNWEMLYLAVAERDNTIIVDIKNGVGKLLGGWGAHAYIVKHSEIPKILKRIENFTHPIDILYLNNSENSNIYVIPDRLIKEKPNVKSYINELT